MESNHSNKISLAQLNAHAWEHRYVNIDVAINLANKAKGNAEDENNKSEFYVSQLTLAQLNFWKTSKSEEVILANEALIYFETHNELLGIARANLICAGMQDQFGQYEKAMQHALNAVKASEQIANASSKSDCYTMLGQIYSRIHDYKQAINALQKGLDIRVHSNDVKAMASSLNLIARNYVLDKKYDEANSFYNQSLELREKNNDIDGIPWTYLGLASLFAEKKEWTSALEYYKKAENSNLKREQRFELLCLIGMGKVALNLSENQQAIDFLNEALLISETLNINSLKAEAHELLSTCHETKGDLQLALLHYKQFNLLRQEILSNDKINTLKNQQIAFSVEHAEKEAEINRLKNVELKNAFDKIALQHHQLEEKNKSITDSITYAKRIQDSYLPEKELFNTLFPEAFLLFKPKDIVSGDFYWYNKLTEPQPSLLFTAADCTGHGVPGAIMSVICCNALNEVVNNKKIHQPNLILNEVRTIVIDAFKKQGVVTQKDGMDISLVRLIKENNTLKLQFAGANNPLWIIRKGKPSSVVENSYFTKTHYLIEIKADKQPIGMYAKMNPFTLHELDLQEGDTLYSFTDGYADQFGGMFGKKLKNKPLKELLLSIQDKPMAEQYTIVAKAYEDWKHGYEQIDDVCMIGVRV